MRRTLSSILMSAGLLLMAWPAITWGYGRLYQRRLAAVWDEAAARRPASAAAAQPSPQRPGPAGSEPEIFARLVIPAVDLNVFVVEGVDSLSLARAPGHLPETGRPGEGRNCAIAGHRDEWFRRLEEVKPGDPVWLQTPDTEYEYVAEEQRAVTPDRTDLLRTGEYPALTLITCTGKGYPNSSHRLLLFCRLRGVHPL